MYFGLPAEAENYIIVALLRQDFGGQPSAKAGAGDGIRTRDLLLGKQTFYQLNYTRIIAPVHRSRDTSGRRRIEPLN